MLYFNFAADPYPQPRCEVETEAAVAEAERARVPIKHLGRVCKGYFAYF